MCRGVVTGLALHGAALSGTPFERAGHQPRGQGRKRVRVRDEGTSSGRRGSIAPAALWALVFGVAVSDVPGGTPTSGREGTKCPIN